MSKLSGNRGEWSEIYVLLKLLGDGVLRPGIRDKEQSVYPLLKVFRKEGVHNFEYRIEEGCVHIRGGGAAPLSLPCECFCRYADRVLKAIKENLSGNFSLPDIEEFLLGIHCRTLKAKSSSKTDIFLEVHDPKTQQQLLLGFSIKSQLGSPSTLLNASKATNFIYEVSPQLCERDIMDINSISSRNKIKERIERVLLAQCNFKFSRTEQSVFFNNLTLIDSLLPHIIAQMVLLYFRTDLSSVMDLAQVLAKDNPMSFDNSHRHGYYHYKIKRFLTDVALGMMPSQVWAGAYDATGGYLVVKKDGSIECHHSYSKNTFEEYLLHTTKLDTASSSRHNFGELLPIGDRLLFKLNLQIRFLQ